MAHLHTSFGSSRVPTVSLHSLAALSPGNFIESLPTSSVAGSTPPASCNKYVIRCFIVYIRKQRPVSAGCSLARDSDTSKRAEICLSCLDLRTARQPLQLFVLFSHYFETALPPCPRHSCSNNKKPHSRNYKRLNTSSLHPSSSWLPTSLIKPQKLTSPQCGYPPSS
jgi:hypothetical protein